MIPALAIGACSARTDQQGTNNAAEEQAAASNASSAINLPLSDEPRNRSTPPDESNVISDAPFTPDSAQGAANVVQTYFSLIEDKNFVEAHRRWGSASDLADGTFAAKFAGYREYHAEVGAPSEIEGAAGSSYVTVPVRTYGVTTEGEQFEQPQVVTLRRANDIDGSTAEQRRWHIVRIEDSPGRR